MTSIFLTIDTEYSVALATQLGPECRAENFARSISCITTDGPAGILFKLQMFARHGLKAVFFVDPMPAMLWGVEAISDIVGPIMAAGHDVQLHIHTEWLALAGAANPLGARTGRNIADFTFEEQCILIDKARDWLMAAGAHRPLAFRAGNYGANDTTLRALAELGIVYDTSHTPGIPDGECGITLGPEHRRPIYHRGVVEVPIGCIDSMLGGLRHAQITALSANEMLAAITHARDEGIADFTLVSHSFELLCRQRRRVNWLVRRRFEKLCAGIEAMAGVDTATFRDTPPRVNTAATTPRAVLPPAPWREGMRIVEQTVANSLYG